VFFAGVLRQRWADRHFPVAVGPASVAPVAELAEAGDPPNALLAQRARSRSA
jgi:hypothetical protein